MSFLPHGPFLSFFLSFPFFFHLTAACTWDFHDSWALAWLETVPLGCTHDGSGCTVRNWCSVHVCEYLRVDVLRCVRSSGKIHHILTNINLCFYANNILYKKKWMESTIFIKLLWFFFYFIFRLSNLTMDKHWRSTTVSLSVMFF